LARANATRFELAALGFALATVPLGAQETTVVRSRVRSSDGAPIGGAVVFLPGTGGTATTAASSGAFALRVPRGPVRLVAAAIGFAPETLLALDPAAALEFWLATAPLSLDPVTVVAEPAYTAASSGAVRSLDTLLRPRESAQEVLRLGVLVEDPSDSFRRMVLKGVRNIDPKTGTTVR
jgi:hypothetical protein